MAEPCVNCSAPLPVGAAFCPECGAASPAASAPLTAPDAWPSQPPRYPPTPVESPPDWHPPAWTAPVVVPDDPPAPLDRNVAAGIVGLVGALVLGVSTFLAWAEITLSLTTVRSQAVTGWDWFDDRAGAGPLLAVLALVAAGFGGLFLARVAPLGARLAVVAVGALSLGLAAYAISDIAQRQSDVQVVGNVTITYGAGMWLVVIGAVAVMAAGVVADHRGGDDGEAGVSTGGASG